MGFYTRVDYNRQLKQSGDTFGVFSGSSTFEQTVTIGSACTVGAGITGCGEFSNLAINPGISASTLQIGKMGLMPTGTGLMDLQLDESGNVVRGASSSKRYKDNLRNIGPQRYTPLLNSNIYFFRYLETGAEVLRS